MCPPVNYTTKIQEVFLCWKTLVNHWFFGMCLLYDFLCLWSQWMVKSAWWQRCKRCPWTTTSLWSNVLGQLPMASLASMVSSSLKMGPLVPLVLQLISLQKKIHCLKLVFSCICIALLWACIGWNCHSIYIYCSFIGSLSLYITMGSSPLKISPSPKGDGSVV